MLEMKVAKLVTPITSLELTMINMISMAYIIAMSLGITVKEEKIMFPHLTIV